MADWSDLTFNAQDTDYIAQLDALTSRSEAVATEVEDARQGEATLDVLTGNINTELTNARQGEVDLVTNLNNYLKNGAIASDLNMAGFKITNLGDATATSDLVTLSQANALILGGASPADIDITSISVGTITNGQRVISDGTNPAGQDNTLLTLDVGPLTANQVAGANSGASAMEAKDLSTISSGAIPAGSVVGVKSGGDGLEAFDTDLEDSMSNLYMHTQYG